MTKHFFYVCKGETICLPVCVYVCVNVLCFNIFRSLLLSINLQQFKNMGPENSNYITDVARLQHCISRRRSRFCCCYYLSEFATFATRHASMIQFGPIQ